MLKLEYTNQFRKDLKFAKKRGKNLKYLEHIISLIQNQKPLPANLRDHFLKGNWNHHRECHVNPDWLLIYKIIASENTVVLVRTGSHADLFE
jgi:mRNA interferase YafQ